MLDPETFFSIGNTLALLGWIGLAIAPTARAVQTGAALALPALLGVAYVGLLAAALAGGGEGGFGSIEDVRALFANDAALTAGWLHYLAFDLFIGAWQAREAARVGLGRWRLLPCLVLTFLAGPAGLLLFLVLRTAKAGRPPLLDRIETP